MQAVNKRNKFDLSKKKKEKAKQRFDKKSILGIKIAGITIKLDKIYVILVSFKKENIL